MDFPQNPLARHRRVTVRDIAAAAGVHYTTVSLALRNSPLLNADTRKQLQELAEKMGYVSDPMLNALIAYRRDSRTPRFQAVLAWINNWPDREALLKVPSFYGYHTGACERARQLGYLVEEMWLHEADMSPEKLQRVLLAQGVRGLLLAPQPYAKMWPGIDFTKFSAITFGYSMQPAVLNLVTNHHYHTMALMLERLVALGYRRIGSFITEDWDAKVESNWTAGWLIACRKYAGQVTMLPHYTGPAWDMTQAKKWFKKHRPDVIIAAQHDYEHVRQLGYAIPEEIGFACLDIDTRNTALSGTYQNSVLIGQKAVDILVAMMHRDERGVPETPIRTLVESIWVDGPTLRPQTPKAGDEP